MNLYGDLPPVGTGSAATPTSSGKALVSQNGWSRPNNGRIGQVPRSLSMGLAGTAKSLNTNLPPTLKPKLAQTATTTTTVRSIINHQLVPAVSTETVTNQKRVHHQIVSDGSLPQNQIAHPNHGASFEVDDPYDPSRPNDYLLWCEERLERKRLDKLADDNRHKMAEGERARLDMERERSEAMESRDVQRLQVSMGAGRGRGRGLSNLPAWMAQYATTLSSSPVEAESGAVSGQFDSQDNDVEGTAASRIMTKMGFSQGEGLGRDGQGILNPLEHRRVSGNGSSGATALIVLDEQDRMRAASRAIAAKLALTDPDLVSPSPANSSSVVNKKRLGLFSNPSSVVLLKNMVGPGEVDDMLAEECKQECSKYGPVDTCVIFEVTDNPDCPAEECVRTFVCFEKQESAVRAFREMNGRFFGGRQIAASFYDEGSFSRRDLKPTPTEWSS